MLEGLRRFIGISSAGKKEPEQLRTPIFNNPELERDLWEFQDSFHHAMRANLAQHEMMKPERWQSARAVRLESRS